MTHAYNEKGSVSASDLSEDGNIDKEKPKNMCMDVSESSYI